MNGYRILIADDEPLIRNSLYEMLKEDGHTVSMACDGEEAWNKLLEKEFDIILTDIKMPKLTGLELLEKIKSGFPGSEVVLITGYGNLEIAVKAMRMGAFDYVTKPIIDNEIKITIKKIMDRNELIQENVNLRKRLEESGARDRFHNLIGRDRSMQKIYNMIEAVADSRATVLLTGDSGTGKGLVAQAIHASDKFRRDKNFVEVSCGALPETLLESELFGHVKGAFTGAVKDRKGRFELADTGTIFLDEIDTLSLTLQVKLLRVLQEWKFERVGDVETMQVNVRVIAATNQRLDKLIKEKKFREDLYYRLNVLSMDLPALRERRGDIRLLAEHFIQKYNSENANKKIAGITDEAMRILEAYDWPGNVRELENVIERSVILAPGHEIDKNILPDALYKNYIPENSFNKNDTLKDILEEPEKDIILKALKDVKGNKKNAAARLGINRATLYNKIRKYNLNGCGVCNDS